MTDVQELLDELARETEPRGADEVFTGATHRAVSLRRRRRVWRVGAAVGAVAAVLVVVVLVTQVSTSDRAHVDVRNETPTPTTPVGNATAAQLAAGNWATIPAAPIPPRIQASVVWTGTELIVWGGATGKNGDEVRSDGAAYDPAARIWRVLPPSPLSARSAAVAVWTGKEVVIWGGYHPGTAEEPEGAAYEPATNSWRPIASGPRLSSPNAVAVWTGDRVVILGGNAGYAYDPRADVWTTLPRIPAHVAPPGFEVTTLGSYLAASDGAGDAFAFVTWEAIKQITPQESQGMGGSDLFQYDESKNRWTDLHARPDPILEPEEAFWVHDRLLVRGDMHAPGALGPGPLPETSAWYDTATGLVTPLAPDALTADQVPAGHFSSAWTGSALFSLNAQGQAGPIKPGDASVYDAERNSWRRLASAPFGCADASTPVWTGGRVLIYCPTPYPSQSAPVGGLEYLPG